ncbi:MAG: site-2 protease family protein [Bacteroidota bacterium]
MVNLTGRTYTLGSIANIPIKVHWSFGLLILFVGYIAYSNDIPQSDLGWFFGYVGVLFVFVIMHEFGHALMARSYGVETKDVIISPIGGVARLQSMPDLPSQELMIAIAGPGVNVVLLILLIGIQLISQHELLPDANQFMISSSEDFIGYLIWINIALVGFNMIPAFPMDGGRVLRAALAMGLQDRLRATRIASIIGQLFAVVFVGLGLFANQYVLMFVGIFVFVTARTEYRQMRLLSRLQSTTVRQVMRREFTILHPEEPISKAFDISPNRSFLVVDSSDQVVGAVPELFVNDARQNNEGHLQVRHRMSTSIGNLGPEMSLETAFNAMNQLGWTIAPVLDSNSLIIGVIDRSILERYFRSH